MQGKATLFYRCGNVALGYAAGVAQISNMARRPRHEFEGAIYHVFNHVNPSRDVFASPAAAGLFEDCLLEARAEYGWRLHAWCIVRESFHVALETPRANLVAGMHWFQSTFAKRVRSLCGGAGSLFSGRYRALPVEGGASLANLANYIHLRPAETGIVSAELLPMFRWSSLRRILRKDCPDFLLPSDWLPQVREISGGADPLAAYSRFLVGIARDPDRRVGIGMRGMTRGPAIGSPDFRRSIPYRAPPAPGEDSWSEALEGLLDSNGRTRDELTAEPKGAPWKVDIALELRTGIGAPLNWLARELAMGTANSVSHHLWLARRSARELASA